MLKELGCGILGTGKVKVMVGHCEIAACVENASTC